MSDIDAPAEEVFEYAGHGPGSVPSNVTHVRFLPRVVEISNGVFGCSSLRELVLNDGLREIGEHAFEGCRSLQMIRIPSTVTKIDDYAFIRCSNLRVVVLNEGLKYINQGAFSDCISLQSITIPSTVNERLI